VCRIAAYFGPAINASAVLTEPERSLERQSRDAREMADSRIAGDGWGVGWFAQGDPTPGLLKSILPLWSDLNAKTAGHAIRSRSIVGHVRFASPGVEVCFTNTPLYALDDHIWTINGQLQPWPGPLSKALSDRLAPEHEADVKGSTDGEMLGALWRTQRKRSGDAAAALRATLRTARSLAAEHGGEMTANILLAHSGGLLAVRFADPGPANSLYCLSGEPRWHGGAIVASEPLDEGPGWREVEPSSLVRVDGAGLRIEPLFRRNAKSA
jgi:glutamine amidotransferase